MAMSSRMYVSIACLGLLCYGVRIDFARVGPQNPALSP